MANVDLPALKGIKLINLLNHARSALKAAYRVI